ncbi:MAG: class II aldolase/adducin family protein [Erysipelotrichaceae bacterium]
MFEKEKEELLEACLQLKEYKLISLTGGNICLRVGEYCIVTPSGMLYEKMIPEDMVVTNMKGVVIEGQRKPSSDLSALIYMYENMPEVKAIIHTHQPYATAIGFANESLPACMVTLIDANHDRVSVAPWTVSSDIGMGKLACDYMGNATAVIMKHHGVITIGKTLEEALFSAVYLEEGSKTYVLARIMGSVPELSDEEIAKESLGWQSYGQHEQ